MLLFYYYYTIFRSFQIFAIQWEDHVTVVFKSKACGQRSLVLTSLRNNSGQTPADVAQAHGFDNCFALIVSKSQLHGPENGVVNRAQIGHGQHQNNGRKRLLNSMDAEGMKKARRVESKKSLVSSSGANWGKPLTCTPAPLHSSCKLIVQ